MPFSVSNLTENGRDRDERQINDRVDETQLIARVIAGDRLAGRTLYDTHAPRVYSLAYRLSGDAEKAVEQGRGMSQNYSGRVAVILVVSAHVLNYRWCRAR